MNTLKQEFIAIENDIKKICRAFENIFGGHGIGKGDPINFWAGIAGHLKYYTDGKIKVDELLYSLADTYISSANTLTRRKHAPLIEGLTLRIYSEDEKAENIVKRLLKLSNKKEKKSEVLIIELLEEIKKECGNLIKMGNLVQKLINEMKKHAEQLENKLKTKTDLEKLRENEYAYAKKIKKVMEGIGKKGWETVCRIYSDEKRAEHIFKRLKVLI